MLTPAATDPNRANEIIRAKSEPLSFGSETIQSYPEDWREVGLGSDKKEEAQPAPQIKKRGRPARNHEG